MKFNFKKITSVLASAVMLGSTMGIAAAAASYPSPFVSGGAADVTIVVGAASPNNVDYIAATDIGTSLSTELSAQSGDLTTEASGGDFVRLDKSSDKLNLGDAINSPFGSTVDEDDMSNLLADGTYTADDNDEFDYEQKITLHASADFNLFRDSDYEDQAGLSDKTPVLGFNISSDTAVLTYTLDFLEDAGSTEDSNNYLDDIDGSDIPMLGKNYYVLTANNGTNSGYTGSWTLLDAAITTTVNEGEEKTVSVEGTDYVISISFISTTEVVLLINGESTTSLSEGDTRKLADGSYVGIKDILARDVAGTVGSVEFSIGRGKLELTHDAAIKLNDDSVDEIKAYLYKTTSSGSDTRIDKIQINWTTDDDAFITEDSSLTMPGFENLVIDMAQVVRSSEEEILLGADSDNIDMKIPIKDGTATIDLMYTNSSGDFQGLGSASDARLATSYNGTLFYYQKIGGSNYHKYFVATYNSSTDCESYLLDLSISEDTTAGRNETSVTNKVTSETITTEKTEGDQIDIGDVSFTIATLKKNSTDKWATLTAGSSVDFNTICTVGGLKIWLPYEYVNVTSGVKGSINVTDGPSPWGTRGGPSYDNDTTGHDYNTYYLFMQGEDKDDTIEGGTAFNFTFDDNSDGEPEISKVNNVGSGGVAGLEEDDSDVYYYYIPDAVGPRIEHTESSSGQDSAKVYYPSGDSETYAEVFLKAPEATIGTGSAVELGSVTKYDNELTDADKAKNLVVVGGSCVNTVAAELLGGSLCAADFTAATGVGADQFLVKVFESPYSASKVAMLVAGYEADDTKKAVTYVTQESPSTDVGTELKKVTATYADVA